ncbi:oocyte-secreted protein 2 [Fukomys damarensis]|uniref:oocyte-secreted protein 2 n=1 Tax=Fukomys damarensis TaxID=885580 RepID=UPI000540311B|nr:oocyte-secreted protein 2 [Fukomys damarensis]
MRVSSALAASTLFAVLIWPCSGLHGEMDVRIYCSLDWVMVSVSPHRSSRSNPYMFVDELVLGSNCPATEIQAYVYHFVYPVSACGIRTQVISEDVLLVETELYYTPREDHSDPEKTSLACITSLKSVWIIPVSTEEDTKLKTSHFISDFQTTPEELGLLNSSQICPS